jgi:hypothetical protein
LGVPERVNVRGKGCGMQPFCFDRVRACNLALNYLINDTFPMSTTPALARLTDIAGCPGLSKLVAVALTAPKAASVAGLREAAPSMPATMPKNEAIVCQLRAELRESR